MAKTAENGIKSHYFARRNELAPKLNSQLSEHAVSFPAVLLRRSLFVVYSLDFEHCWFVPSLPCKMWFGKIFGTRQTEPSENSGNFVVTASSHK